MAKITVKKTKDYSIVSNKVLRDTNLSMKARFLLVFMLSLADTWEYSVAGLAKAVGCGRDAITSGLQELEANGYLERNRSRDEKGRLKEMEYVLYEEPPKESIQSEDEHVQENPMEEKSAQANQAQINTNITNTNLNKYQEEEERAREDAATADVDALTPEKMSRMNVVQLYNRNIHPLYSAIEYEKLLDLCERYGDDWVSAAIREAVECNARTIRYIEGVLKAWENRGGCRDRDKKADAVDELADFIERGGKDA